MWKSLKTNAKAFQRGSPGEQFKAYYKARVKAGEKPAAFSRVLNLVLAAACFVLGVVFSLMPVVPGFVFFFASAFFLAAESFRAARLLDSAEVSLRKLWSRIQGLRKKAPPRSRSHARRIPRPAK